MPIYEYACQNCQNTFEVKQGINDAPLTSCSKCEGPVTKLISAPAIMFKGSGWYVTDYSDKLKPPGKEETGGKTDGDKKEGTTEKKETSESTGTTSETKKDAAPSTSSSSSDQSSASTSSAASSSTSTASPSTSSSSKPTAPPSSSTTK